MHATYLIPDCNLAELEARIAKLNKRARKLGVAEIAFTKTPDHVRYQARQLQSGCEIGGPATRLVWRNSIEKVANPGSAYLANAFEPTGVVMQWWKIEVNGQAPTLTDWTFVAVLEPLVTEDGAVNLMQTLPGETCPSQYRDIVGRCDHCRTTRKRNQTFVVRHSDGSHKCVGRQCIKDFLGYHADPHQLASWAEMLAELGGLCESAGDEEWLGGGHRAAPCWDLVHFLALTTCRIRLHGWLGRGKAREMAEYKHVTATADAVLDLLTPPSAYASDEQKREWKKAVEEHTINDADKATAEAAIEWAKAITTSELESNNYLANVNLVARVGATGRKTAGVAASIIVAYNKAVEQETKRQQFAARPPSHHIGEVGKRIDCMKVTCEKVIAKDGQYGTTGIHKMHDEQGNDLTWFASSGNWLKEGETVHVAATVKDHSEYQGRKQTIITRVTVWSEEGLIARAAKLAKKAAREAKKASRLALV